MIVSSSVSAFVGVFGLLALPIVLLISCQFADYVTGVMASHYNDEVIDNKKSFKGICAKLSMYFLVFIGFAIDCLLAYCAEQFAIGIPMVGLVAAFVAIWLIFNEMISITENCGKMDVTVPFLTPLLNSAKQKVEDKSNFK